MHIVLSGSTVETAIRNGLDYLNRIQLSSGEFATFTGPSPDLSDAISYPNSVYVTTFVVRSLGFLAADRRIKRIQPGAPDFLEAEEEAGVWNHEGHRFIFMNAGKATHALRYSRARPLHHDRPAVQGLLLDGNLKDAHRAPCGERFVRVAAPQHDRMRKRSRWKPCRR